MRILSMREPWLCCVLSPGPNPKRIENRKWNTHYRGPILLHRSKGLTQAYVDTAAAWLAERKLSATLRAAWAGPDPLRMGGVCGYAEIVDVMRPASNLTGEALFKWHDADVRWWMQEQYGFVLKNVKPLPFIPWRGGLGLRIAPAVLADACLGALNGVCPCKSELDDPGPTHLATCPYVDPLYDAEGP